MLVGPVGFGSWSCLTPLPGWPSSLGTAGPSTHRLITSGACAGHLSEFSGCRYADGVMRHVWARRSSSGELGVEWACVLLVRIHLLPMCLLGPKPLYVGVLGTGGPTEAQYWRSRHSDLTGS